MAECPQEVRPDGLVQRPHELFGPFGLGKVDVFGSPFHALNDLRPLAVPPPEEEGGCEADNPIITDRTFHLKVPALPEIVRSEAQIAFDTANNYVWRTELLYNDRSVYGVSIPTPEAQLGEIPIIIPCVGMDGNVWKVRIYPGRAQGIGGTGPAADQDFHITCTAELDFRIGDDYRPNRVLYTKVIDHHESEPIYRAAGSANVMLLCDVNSLGRELIVAIPIRKEITEGFVPFGFASVRALKFYTISIIINPAAEEVADIFQVGLTLLYSSDTGLGNVSNSAAQPETLEVNMPITATLTQTITPGPGPTCERVNRVTSLAYDSGPSNTNIFNEQYSKIFRIGGVNGGSFSGLFSITDHIAWAYYDTADVIQRAFIDLTVEHSIGPSSVSFSGGLVQDCSFSRTTGPLGDCSAAPPNENTIGNLSPSWTVTTPEDVSVSFAARMNGVMSQDSATYHFECTQSGHWEIDPDPEPFCSGDIIVASNHFETESFVSIVAWGTSFSQSFSWADTGQDVLKGKGYIFPSHVETSGYRNGLNLVMAFGSVDLAEAPGDPGIFSYGFVAFDFAPLTNKAGSFTKQKSIFEGEEAEINESVVVVSESRYGPAVAAGAVDPDIIVESIAAGTSAAGYPSSTIPGISVPPPAEALAYNPITLEIARQTSGTWF